MAEKRHGKRHNKKNIKAWQKNGMTQKRAQQKENQKIKAQRNAWVLCIFWAVAAEQARQCQQPHISHYTVGTLPTRLCVRSCDVTPCDIGTWIHQAISAKYLVILGLSVKLGNQFNRTSYHWCKHSWEVLCLSACSILMSFPWNGKWQQLPSKKARLHCIQYPHHCCCPSGIMHISFAWVL